VAQQYRLYVTAVMQKTTAAADAGQSAMSAAAAVVHAAEARLIHIAAEAAGTRAVRSPSTHG